MSARKSVEYSNAKAQEIYPEFNDLNKMWNWSKGLSQPVCPSVMFVHSLLHEATASSLSQKIIYGLGAEMMLGNLRISKTARTLWYEKYLPISFLKKVYNIVGLRFFKSKTKGAFLMAAGDWVERFMIVRGPYYPWMKKYFKDNSQDFWTATKKKMSTHFSTDLDLYDAIVKLFIKSWVNYLQYRDMKILGSQFNIKPIIPFDSLRVARVLFSVPLKHRERNSWNKQLIRDIMKPYVANHLYSNPVKSLIIPYKDFFSGKENEIIQYLSTSYATKDLFDYESFETDIGDLPEAGFVLMHILGVAVWYDSNFDSNRREKFDIIFKK